MGMGRGYDFLLAIGMWLLLFLYARWLNWNDARREYRKRRREECTDGTPLPDSLRWPPERIGERGAPETNRFATHSRR